MISYRNADILRKVKNKNDYEKMLDEATKYAPIENVFEEDDTEYNVTDKIPTSLPHEPTFNSRVKVHAPEPEDDWVFEFDGRIDDFIDEGVNGNPKMYIIKDQEDNVWQMTRDKFDLEETSTSMPEGDALLGESVYVKDSEEHGQDENWYGRIKSYNSANRIYGIEDKVGDMYYMTRDKFEVQ